jgi:hypothetical protein
MFAVIPSHHCHRPFAPLHLCLTFAPLHLSHISTPQGHALCQCVLDHWACYAIIPSHRCH